MKQERDLQVLKEYYKTERLPQLLTTLESLYEKKPAGYVAKLQAIILEVNQALDFIHSEKADHMPHYRLTEVDGEWIRSQYIPAFEKESEPKKSNQTFNSGPAEGMVKPHISKEASYKDAPGFDLAFLDPAFAELDTYIGPPTKPNTNATEIVIYDAGKAGEFNSDGWAEDYQDLDDIDEMLTTVDNILDDPNSYMDEDNPDYNDYGDEWTEEDQYYAEYGDDLGYEDDFEEDDEYDGYGVELNSGEQYIFFEAGIEAGMFMLQLIPADGGEMETLFLPHVSVNFPMVKGLIQGYREAGGIAILIFSAADQDANLILPTDPTDPSKPIDPSLN